MIIEQNDVELLSIKMKSKQDIDSEIARNAHANGGGKLQNLMKLNEFPFNFGACGSDHVPEDSPDDHYESSVRLLTIDRTANGACGFHLTRTKWDPYPWVSAIDRFTPAEKSGLSAGDCILEVNGCDVLGLRITEIAKLVKSSQHQVTLLLWSTKCSSDCDEESLCAAPMPRSMQRLSAIVQCVLSVIECPVCRDTITPPAMQCQNGHLLCINCRIRAENCPVCRDRYFPRPALIAEQLQAAITSAFNICRNEDKVRQKIFGRHNRQQQMVKSTLECFNLRQVHKSSTESVSTLPDTEILQSPTLSMTPTASDRCEECVRRHDADTRDAKRNKRATVCDKLLTKLLNFKAYSMENLTATSTNVKATNSSSSNTNNSTQITNTFASAASSALFHPTVATDNRGRLDVLALQQTPTNLIHRRQYGRNTTNQLNDNCIATNVVRPKQLLSATIAAAQPIVNNDLTINSNPHCCKQMSNNGSGHFSSSLSDLTINNTAAATMSATSVQCVLESKPSAAAKLVSCLVSTTDNTLKKSPLMYKKRPCANSSCDNLSQSITRALPVQPKNLRDSHNSALSSQHKDDTEKFNGVNDLSFEKLDNSTPSTVSLKDSPSSSSTSISNSLQ